MRTGSRRAVLVAAAVAVLALLAAGIVALASGGERVGAADHPVARPEVVPVTAAPRAERPTVEPVTLGAVAAGPEVALYDSPQSKRRIFSLPNPTHENVPLTFSIERRAGDRFLVRLPMRPNGSTAWVDAADVTTHRVPRHIVVDLSDRELTLFEGDEAVMAEPVAVGSVATPTPVGDFYVDISVPDPGAPYGAHMLSVAGFSDVLTDFGGGIGQIAIHGWDDPSVMGQAVSNGCVRLPNGTVTHLAEQTVVGTPVHIRP